LIRITDFEDTKKPNYLSIGEFKYGDSVLFSDTLSKKGGIMILGRKIARVGRAGGSLYVAIPKEFRLKLNITRGDIVEIKQHKDSLVIKKLELKGERRGLKK